MNLPQIATDTHHQYIVLRELRSFGDYDIIPLDPDYQYLLNEAVLRIPCISTIKELVTLFKDGDQALLQRCKRSDVEVKYKTRDEDKIYLATRPGSFLHEFVNYARAGNAPLAFYFWAGVALLSAACRRKVCFQGAETMYLNMYVILGAARAAGKGQALKGMTNILELTNKKVGAAFNLELARNPANAYRIKDQIITRIPSDITPEALVSLLYERQQGGSVDKKKDTTKTSVKLHDATGILALDELGTFLGKDAFNSSKKPLFLTEIKEASNFGKRTKKDGVEELLNTGITMIACCAPDWLSKCIDREMLGGGFTDRCTWIYRTPDWDAQMDRSIASGAPKDPLKANALADWLIDNVLSIDKLEAVVPTTATEPRLTDIWEELVESSRKEFEKFGLDDSKNSASRVFSGIIQLASLLAVSDVPAGRTIFEPIPLTMEHVDLAHAIVMKEEASMTTFLAQASRSETTARDANIKDYIVTTGGCVMRSLLMRKFKGTLGMDDIMNVDNALNNLMEMESIEMMNLGRTKVYRTVGHECDKCRV